MREGGVGGEGSGIAYSLERFCEEDIDQILERRAHVIQLESEGKGSTFSKVSREGREKEGGREGKNSIM